MLEVVFVTTSREKLAHAKYLARNTNIVIGKQKYYGIGYVEPRIENRTDLLNESIEDAITRWNKNVSNPDNKFFFIEDTSVIIHSLSSDNEEYPGVDVKYWMQENSFEDIDNELKLSGNDRKVTVRSDILLRHPLELADVLDKKVSHFSSSTDGVITEIEFDVAEQPYYTWLNDRTFNKWFIPKGYSVPMSCLPIHSADEVDFRAGAFKSMFEFIDRFKPIIDKTKRCYRKKATVNTFDFLPYLYIIVGPTCSGKTTLAQHLSRNYGYFHIEASDFMAASYFEIHGIRSNVKIRDFAEEALVVDPCIVADQLINIVNQNTHLNTVITGFRSNDEIECFQNKYNGNKQVEVVLVQADRKIRFERNKLREREDSSHDYNSFIKTDQQQQRMGLSNIEAIYENNLLLNEGSFENFYDVFDLKYSNRLEVLKGDVLVAQPKLIKNKLEDEILYVMGNVEKTGNYFTTAKIAKLINEKLYNGKSIKSKNNVSRYFNINYYPYYEIKAVDGKKMYRLSQTGINLSKLLYPIVDVS